MVNFTHQQTGTAEAMWRRGWKATRQLAVESLFDGRLPERAVLLAAHPDDETLGAGGLLARLAVAGVELDIVVASDGEASHPQSSTHSQERLAEVRRAEMESAMMLLAPAGRLHFLGLPDGGLSPDAVGEALRPVLEEEPLRRTLLISPWRLDGHPDHEAVGAAAAIFSRERGWPLLEYPIWLWHWGVPEALEDLWDELNVVQLSRNEQELKRSAARVHASQTAALSDQPGDEVLLGTGVLEHFEREFETFLVTRTESVFEQLHATEQDPWKYLDSHYERRKRGITLAVLPRDTFENTLEIGCSVGLLTRDLAARSASLTALDTSRSAVQRARERVRVFPGAQVLEETVPEDWPAGTFDLIVLSETGYYLSARQLGVLIGRIVGSLAADGVVLLCHWRHPIDGWELDGDAVHQQFRSSSGLRVQARLEEEDFLLELFGHAGMPSAAAAEGLV